MHHLGFHRGAQKDKDKERSRATPASQPEPSSHEARKYEPSAHEARKQEPSAHEARKHEKLQREFQTMIPGTPASTAAPSAASSAAPSRGLSPPNAAASGPPEPSSSAGALPPFAPAPRAQARGQGPLLALDTGGAAGGPTQAALSDFPGPTPVSPPGSATNSPPLSRTTSRSSVAPRDGAAPVNKEVPYQGEHQPWGTLLYTAGTGRPPRLEVYDIGNSRIQHWHHMRPARRQEKLARMLKDLFKREPHHDADGNVQEHSPSNSRAGSPAPGPGPAQVTDSIERDRDAAEAVWVASHGNQPPTLLAGIESNLSQSDRDPAEVLNQLLSQRKVTDPTLVQRYGQLSSVVGKGSFGVVRLAQKPDPYNKNRKLVYAVKEFHPNSGESESRYLKRLASEFCLASSLRNNNIIHTLDLLRDGKTKFCGVMEYCAGGDLYSLIVVAGKLEPVEADCFFKQIMRGVSYMHEMGVAHRDLKPENILLTSRGCCKLTDFGNAECFRMAWEKDVHLSTSIAGSGPYIAPEEYKKSTFDPRAVDVWAAGVIYMAMSTGRHLWREAKPSDEFYAKYLEGRKGENGYEPIERLKMSKRRNVVYSVLDPVASRRLTARQVLNSEWGREIVVCEAGEGEIAKP